MDSQPEAKKSAKSSVIYTPPSNINKQNEALIKHVQRRVYESETRSRSSRPYNAVDRLRKSLDSMQGIFTNKLSLPHEMKKVNAKKKNRRDHIHSYDAEEIIAHTAEYQQIFEETAAKHAFAAKDVDSEEDEVTLHRSGGITSLNGDFFLPGTVVYYGATISLQVESTLINKQKSHSQLF